MAHWLRMIRDSGFPITDTDWKQAITGVAEGVKAGYYAYEYVSDGSKILPLKGKKQ